MLDFIMGRHTWNCKIRTHIRTNFVDTRTYTPKTKQKVGKVKKTGKEKKEGEVREEKKKIKGKEPK